MKEQKSNYLELKAPLRWPAKWFEQLQDAMAKEKIPVKWQDENYHITAVFVNNTTDREKVLELSNAFEHILSKQAAPSLTLDKVDAFKTRSGEEIIVNLTSTYPSKEFMALVDNLRKEARKAGVDIEDEFRLHITLGRIDSTKVSISKVQKITDGIRVPSFSLCLNEAEYRFYRGSTIRSWKMNSITKINNIMNKSDYKKINYEVMTDTKQKYESVAELREAVRHSLRHQYMVAEEENIDQPKAEKCNTQFICSGKRSFEAAKSYQGKKVAVLNFANNHSVGGGPFSAGAQEESLCRCSTLFPCLQAMWVPFYQNHIYLYDTHKINFMGNDDLIYTPDVVVFKTDERTDPIYPQMMERSEWYKVDVITCAAPDMRGVHKWPDDYEEVITRRIKKILDVAAKERVEVLILGAWGCGAFKNDPTIVSKVFYSLLKNYDFEVVEFALASGDGSNSPFAPLNTSQIQQNKTPQKQIITEGYLSEKQQGITDPNSEGGFSVTFEDGTVIYETTSVKTFIESLKKIGLKKINESPCPEHTHYKVVDTREKTGKTKTQKEEKDEDEHIYYIYTSLKDEQKIADLYKISSLFGLNMNIEVYGPAKAPKTKLRVTFPDENLVIENNTASETFIAAVEHMNLWYVMITGIVLHAVPIVSRKLSEKYPRESAQRNGFYVTYHGSNEEKQSKLLEIAERLEKRINVEII